MKICFVVSQIFAWGKYGGFGSLTRTIGKELASRGIEVFVVTIQRAGQPTVQKLDGMTIMGFPTKDILFSGKPYLECDADIYHSEEPSMGTYWVQKSTPNKKHIVTSQDPRTNYDWMVEARYFSPKQAILSPPMYLYEKNYFIKKAVQRADAVYCQAKYITEKTKSLYALTYNPDFLPNPVVISDKTAEKFFNKMNFLKIPRLIQKKINNVIFAIKRVHEIGFAKLNFAVFLSFLSYLAGVLAIYLIAQALRFNIPLISIIWIRAAVMCLEMLPISISGLGVREGAFVFLLKNYNIPSSDAMALSLIIFSVVVSMASIGGAFEAWEFLFKRRRA